MLAQFDGLVPATRSFGYGMRGGGFGLWSHGGGFPIGFVVGALIFAGLVAAVIVLAVRVARRGRRSSESIEIAKARYARGEISKNDFEELKKDLS